MNYDNLTGSVSNEATALTFSTDRLMEGLVSFVEDPDLEVEYIAQNCSCPNCGGCGSCAFCGGCGCASCSHGCC